MIARGMVDALTPDESSIIEGLILARRGGIETIDAYVDRIGANRALWASRWLARYLDAQAPTDWDAEQLIEALPESMRTPARQRLVAPVFDSRDPEQVAEARETVIANCEILRSRGGR